MKVTREIVNGALLGNYLGKKVSIIGFVTDINQNATSFEMRSVDNMTITIKVSSVLDDMIEGYVEVSVKLLGFFNLKISININ